jgi:hypothetical protein
MARERMAHLLRLLLPQTGAAFDIGEEQRDCAGAQIESMAFPVNSTQR